MTHTLLITWLATLAVLCFTSVGLGRRPRTTERTIHTLDTAIMAWVVLGLIALAAAGGLG